MAKPTEKDPAFESELASMTGFSRRQTILDNKCAPAPIGCGRSVDPKVFIGLVSTADFDKETPLPFRDELSLKEYSISGLCQACQDSIFGGDDG